MQSGGEQRSYVLVAPPDEAAPRPLVIALHGWLGTPEQMATMTGFSPQAARRGFAVAYPAGEWRSWGIDQDGRRGAADAAFLARLVADVSARVKVDPARIYVAGFSNGGFMAQALACSGQLRLAGIAIVASGLAAPEAGECDAGAAVPFLLIQGTGDPVVKVDGTGRGPNRILPAWRTLAFWAAKNGCDGFGQMKAASAEAGVSIMHAVGLHCRRADTEAWFVQGAGHGWPGSSFAYPAFVVGRQSHSLDATSIVLDFLLRQKIGVWGRVPSQDHGLQGLPPVFANTARAEVAEAEEKDFFFEKKKQKTFVLWCRARVMQAAPRGGGGDHGWIIPADYGYMLASKMRWHVMCGETSPARGDASMASVAELREAGQAALQANDADAGEAAYRALSARCPEDIHALIGLGFAARMRGQRGEARETVS